MDKRDQYDTDKTSAQWRAVMEHAERIGCGNRRICTPDRHCNCDCRDELLAGVEDVSADGAKDAVQGAIKGPNDAMKDLMAGYDDEIKDGFRKEYPPQEADLLIRLYEAGFLEDKCERILEIVKAAGFAPARESGSDPRSTS